MKQHHPDNGRAPPGRTLTERLLSVAAAILISCANITPAYSQTPLGFITPGTPCDLAGASTAPNWDSIMQCNSSLVWQRAALQLGSTSDACNASTAGKIQWTGTLFQGCNGTSWTSFGSGGGGSAAGANTQIQFNNTGAFGASSNLVWDNSNTRAGIGTASPAATLHVNGEAIVGKTSLSCSATTKGALRYDTAADAWTYCNGSSWVPFESAGACQGCTDATPAAIAFTDEPATSASTLIQSNIVQITGFDCTVTTSISGTGGAPAYRICTNSNCTSVTQNWTTGTSSLTSGQYVQLRMTSSATDNQTYTATFVAGQTTASPWSVRTLISNCGPPSSPGTVCPDGTIYAGLTPDGNVPMYTTRCDIGQTWNGSSCTGSRTINITWNNGSATMVSTGYTNTNTGKANTIGLAALSDAESPHYAAQTCDDLGQNLYSDWYLPARNELNLLYTNRAAIGNFFTSGSTSYNYHSSTELSADREYRRSFVDGGSPIGYKNNTVFIYLRCARRN